MGLTPFDVSNLNSAIAGLGNTFAERRAEALRAQQLGIEQDIRQKMLDAEMRRVAAEEGRQNLLAQGTVDTWLQDDDTGGVSRFQGPQSGLDQIQATRQQQGKSPLTVMEEPPNAKPRYGEFTMDTPVGRVTQYLDSPDQVDETLEHAKKIGGTLPQPGQSGQAEPVQVDKYAAGLEDQAGNLEDQADQLDQQQTSGPGQWDPTIQANINRNRQQAAALRARAKSVRATRQPVDPTQFETVTTGGIDLTTGLPKVTTTRKVPVGAPGGSAAPGGAGLGQVLHNAQAAIAAGKDPVAVKQRYKQLTGLDYPQ